MEPGPFYTPLAGWRGPSAGDVGDALKVAIRFDSDRKGMIQPMVIRPVIFRMNGERKEIGAPRHVHGIEPKFQYSLPLNVREGKTFHLRVISVDETPPGVGDGKAEYRPLDPPIGPIAETNGQRGTPSNRGHGESVGISEFGPQKVGFAGAPFPRQTF